MFWVFINNRKLSCKKIIVKEALSLLLKIQENECFFTNPPMFTIVF